MKKLLFVFIFIFAIFANAEYLNTTTQCNNGPLSSNSASSSSSSTSSASGYNQSGIPPASCVLATTHIAPGFGLSATVNDPSFFYFDSGYLVNLSGIGNGIRIRFVVYEDEKDYNAIQALVQTGYATRAPVHVIFENPTVSVIDYATYKALKKTGNQGKTCYTVSDLNNQVSVLNCPIQAISLDAN